MLHNNITPDMIPLVIISDVIITGVMITLVILEPLYSAREVDLVS